MKRFLPIIIAAFALWCCSPEDNGTEAFFLAELETQGKLPAKNAVARISVRSSSEWNGRLNRVEGDTRKGIRFLSGEGSKVLEVSLPDNTKEEEVEYEVSLSCLDAGVDGFVIGLVQMAGEVVPPGPGPDADAYQPGWYELPKMNIGRDGKYRYNTKDDTQYYAWHFCSGGEIGPDGGVARNYTACYSAEHHCPLWIAAPRHPMYVGSGRHDSYRPDPDVPEDIQYSSTSVGGGCNKGHMLGSAERTCSKATNEDVFYYTNIAPQLSANFNTGGGRWNVLEDFIDGICSSVSSNQRDTLYEVVGTYFDDYTDAYGASQAASTISYCGRTDVHMPTMFYYVVLCTKKSARGKAVVDCSKDELQCVAFVRAHVNVRQAVTATELMSVSDLEELTGVSYFYNVPNAPKDSFTASDWGL